MKKRLHEGILFALRREILTKYKPGERLPSEAELARRFEVSVVTLRNATMTLESEGFVQRISGVGVVVSDFIRSRQLALVSQEVAVYPRPLYFHLRFAPALQRNLLMEGWKAENYLQLESSPDGLDDLREGMSRGRYSAVIWTLGEVPKEFLLLAKKDNVTILGGMDNPLLHVDYDAMIRTGVDHLVSQGCRRIAGLFSGPPYDTPSQDDRKASRTFSQRLAYHDIPTDPRWTVQDTEAQLAGSGWQGFRDLWSASHQRPDGVLVLDDVLYRDAARAILELGIKVPSELKIVTHSNRGEDFLQPFPVAQLEIDPDEMTASAARFVIGTLEGHQPTVENVPFRLIEAFESKPAFPGCGNGRVTARSLPSVQPSR